MLALLALGRHDGYRTWKAFDWEAMVRLHANGYITDPVGNAKSELFTEDDARKSQRLLLAQQHMRTEERMRGLHIADFLARGRIFWDENEDGRLPMLVIDGREISWEEFGRMVRSFEGWQFKLPLPQATDYINDQNRR